MKEKTTRARATTAAAGEGCLYLVATPVGNMEDITYRALRVLKEADLVAAEDTRHSRKLLAHFEIHQPVVSYYREQEKRKSQKLLALLAAGKKIALISDAGTPGISDPGFLLVKAAVENGIPVVPVPGASALLAAVVASGLPAGRFVFEGFLPRNNKERQARLSALRDEERTIILYASPHRLLADLRDLQKYLGEERRIVIARELTKGYEEFWRGSIAQARRDWEGREIRGEFTLVVAGAPPAPPEDLTAKYRKLYEEIVEKEKKGEKFSIIVQEIAAREGISRRGLYQYCLEKKKGES
ncbi:MAG: 16S rRNA (cytidine(1402)-2'-O)-methyltransferase [Firmicutes bacterium]|nr:16S rRNA (cytidine(1402)-2'-O)-methyltransferase [Bacillota bacterium]